MFIHKYNMWTSCNRLVNHSSDNLVSLHLFLQSSITSSNTVNASAKCLKVSDCINQKMKCHKNLEVDIMKIKTPSNLPITINRFIEYELHLSEFHSALISQTMRKLYKVFNQPCSSSRNRHIYADVYSE